MVTSSLEKPGNVKEFNVREMSEFNKTQKVSGENLVMEHWLLLISHLEPYWYVAGLVLPVLMILLAAKSL